MVQLDHVCKVYRKDWVALQDVSLYIRSGEMVFILGPSGAGKTTLLNLIALSQRPTRGSVLVLDYDSTTIKDRQLPFLRRRMGVIFQDFKLLQDRTIFENVALVLRLLGAEKNAVSEKVLDVLHRVDLIDHRDKFPYQLSGGEQQRVGIARALINDPEVLLADEPTGNINEEKAIGILLLLQKINAEGTTVVMATHDRRLVGHLPYRKVELDQGRIQADTKEPAQSGPEGANQ
jgi:cell division transport system ATP-binding protein